MKVLFLSADTIPHFGGKSTHIENLMSAYKQMGIDCDVFETGKIELNGVYFLRRCYMKGLRTFSIGSYMLHWRKFVERSMGEKVWQLVRTEGYDAISTQDAISGVVCGYLKRKEPNIPVSLTMHTYFGLECTLDGGVNKQSYFYKRIRLWEESALNNVDSVICVDSRIKEHVNEVMRTAGYNHVPVSVVHNFTNTNVFAPSEGNESSIREEYGLGINDFIGICVRRLVEKNGVEYAVKAIALIDNPQVKLLIIGEGPENKKIKEVISKNHLESRIILCGPVENRQIVSYYHNCDFAVIPSITVNGLQEATSISAIEAMACGIPVVASSIGGLKEMITDMESGLLTKEQDPADIAKAITYLYEDRDLYEKISRQAREIAVHDYSYFTAAQKYLDVFNL